jgi:hypothetical protein
MVEMEEWKEFKDYNYEVSNLGKVRNKKTKRILRTASKGGYSSVGLSKNGKGKTFSIHQLVGLCFLENSENKPQINHLDKQRSNNSTNNLEWCTAAENNAHKLLTLEVKTNQNMKIWRVDTISNDKLELYNSIQDAAKWCVENGYASYLHNTQGNISNAVNGKYKTSCGFKWELYEQTNLENEIWKNITIKGITYDKYFVSNLGRFKNSKGIIMENYKPHHSGYIYARVNKLKHSMHHLVASTFIENPYSKPVVNHIDGDKTNNAVSNLEWCTVTENNQHNHNVGLIKCFTRKIGQYNLEGKFIKEYNSIIQAIKETGIKGIKEVLYNKQKTSGGFIWKYLD